MRPASPRGRRSAGRRSRSSRRELAGRPFLVGAAPTIADLAVYGYAHAAEEAQIPLAPYPAVTSWIARLEALPGFANDLAPYPANAGPGAGRSIYDPRP